MQKKHLFTIVTLLFLACKEHSASKKIAEKSSEKTAVTYAKGLKITNYQYYTIVHISNPWPGSDVTYSYLLKKKDTVFENESNFDAVIRIPISSIVVTSTTHIPSLEMLGVEHTLVGFPNTNYVSSEKTRKLIDSGIVKELGKNEALNTEVLVDLNPNAVITFSVEGQNKTVTTLQKTGIPVLYNADWTEMHPLGKAEWIKFFGALFDKEEEASTIFNEIVTNYQKAKKLANTVKEKPTILSGAMYKDTWYLPQGESWAAQFIIDAHGSYLWEETEGTGSLSLNIESVLEKGQKAEYWIGPGQFSSYKELAEAHPIYKEFEAYKNQKIYSFANQKGATGGVLYYEIAPNRPDLVLQDIIKVLHPQLLQDIPFTFFAPLQ